jgi:hypothetical protein
MVVKMSFITAITVLGVGITTTVQNNKTSVISDRAYLYNNGRRQRRTNKPIHQVTRPSKYYQEFARGILVTIPTMLSSDINTLSFQTPLNNAHKKYLLLFSQE